MSCTQASLFETVSMTLYPPHYLAYLNTRHRLSFNKGNRLANMR